MTIRELVTTCQNQWKGSSLKMNDQFKMKIINIDEETTYYFNIDYLNNDDWFSVEHEEVEYWSLENNVLTIGFNMWRVI